MSGNGIPKKKPVVAALRGAFLLLVFAVFGAGAVALTHVWTKDRITENQQRYVLRTLHEILPDSAYDNALYDDTLEVDAPALSPGNRSTLVYRARKNGQPVAAILRVIAPDGYSGDISLLVGIYESGEVAGVRVVAHRETPGLGDDIEVSRSPWIRNFRGKSLGDPPLRAWAVKRDGGAFDQFTGATITPRAVVRSVRNALLYFQDHRDTLFAQSLQDRK